MNDEKLEAKIVIVGHVDHGKSTLIGRLLYDTDSLPTSVRREVEAIEDGESGGLRFAALVDHLKEERERGITIDTAQVYLETDQRRIVIIDAPGHREFLKNMITGATQATAALLVVDVYEGMREQTQRHAHMLSLVGVRQLVVAVNKMDAVGYRRVAFESVADEIGRFLEKLELVAASMVPVSALDGENVVRASSRMTWWDGPELLSALESLPLPTRVVGQPLRLPLQDVYAVGGKRILVGRVEAGRIRNGDRIIGFPSGVPATVRSVETFLADPNEAAAGESIGITVDRDGWGRRGEVVAHGDVPPRVDTRIRARIFSLAQADLRLGHEFSLKLATQEVPARLAAIESRVDSASLAVINGSRDVVRETEVAEVMLEAPTPIAFDPHSSIPELGRFVLVSAGETLAGGTILA